MTSDHRQNISRLPLMLSSKPGSVLDVNPKLKKVCPVSELQKTQTILLWLLLFSLLQLQKDVKTHQLVYAEISP